MLQNSLRLFGTTFRSLVPNVPRRNVTIKSGQTSSIYVQPRPEQFSREILRDLVEKPTPEQLLEMQREQEIKDRLQRIYENKHNDKNPANFLKVKVNALDKYKSAAPAATQELSTEVGRHLNQPVILVKQPKTPKVTVQGLRNKVPVGMKKLVPLMRAVIGKHIYDAVALCLNTKTKAAKFILSALKQVKNHANQAGLDEKRLYVLHAISGKQRRWLRVRYMAKGRGSYMTRNTSRLWIKLEERPVEDMFKSTIQGKFPPMLAYMMRETMLKNDADYDQIRRNAFMLTAKGRQQRKLMFRRQVINEQLALKAQGKYVSRYLISRKILEEESMKFGELYRSSKQHELTGALSDRQALFKKNEEAAGF